MKVKGRKGALSSQWSWMVYELYIERLPVEVKTQKCLSKRPKYNAFEFNSLYATCFLGVTSYKTQQLWRMGWINLCKAFQFAISLEFNDKNW